MAIHTLTKRVGITVLVLLCLLLCGHLIIRSRAKQILAYIVSEASNGQYAVEASAVKFTYFPFTVRATGLQFAPADSSLHKVYYTATADTALVQLPGIWPIITHQHFKIKRVHIAHPQVTIYSSDTSKGPDLNFNQRQDEMQENMVRALSEFKVSACSIVDAGIEYRHISKPERPLAINHISLKLDSVYTARYFKGADTVGGFFANLWLHIQQPDIRLPDTSLQVSVGDVLLDTRRNIFNISQFSFKDRNRNGTVDSVNLSLVQLRNLHWQRWLQEGVVEIDSLTASAGATFFDFSDRMLFALKPGQQRTPPKINVHLPIQIHALEIKQIQYGLRTMAEKQAYTVQLAGDSLAVGELALVNDSLRPLQVGKLAFKVTNFINTSAANRHESGFERLVIDHNNLEFINYFRLLPNSRPGGSNRLDIPSLKVIDFDLDELLQYRLVASKLVLQKPALNIDLFKSQRKKDADADIASITKSLRPSLAIKQVSIKDASIVLNPKESPTDKITIENLSTEIDARELLAANTVMEMVNSATALSSSGFRVTGSQLDLEVKRSSLNSTQDGVYLEQVKGSIGNDVELDLHGVSLLDKSRRFDVTHLQTIELDNVSVQSGTVHLTTHAAKNNQGKQPPVIIIHSLTTGNIDVDTKNHNGRQLAVSNVQLAAANLQVKNNMASWDNMRVKAGKSSFFSKQGNITADNISLQQPGSIAASNIRYHPMAGSSIKELYIPMASLKTFIPDTKAIELDKAILDIYNPVIKVEMGETGAKISDSLKGFAGIRLQQVQVHNPQLAIIKKKVEGELRFITADGLLQIQQLDISESGSIKAGSLKAVLQKPLFVIDSNRYQPNELQLSARNLIVGKTVAAFIDSASVFGLSLKLGGALKTDLKAANAGLTNWAFSSIDSFSLPVLLRKHSWWASAAALHQQARNHTISVYNPAISAIHSSFSFDSMSIIPLTSRAVFWQSQPFEKDYITVKLGATQATNWVLPGAGKITSFEASKLATDKVDFLIERDKTRPADTVGYRPLLTASLKRIPLLFAIDTIQISNSFVRHNLIPEKSKQEGYIYFSQMNGYLFNVKNTHYQPDDSLRLRLRSQLMGEGNLTLGFRQAYTDSLQGFWLRARMGAFDMSSLNPLLTPLLSIKIDRGKADTMLLLAKANDYVALGNMDLRYKGLRVSILRKGQDEYFLSKFFNWLANVVVRSEDKEEQKRIFQERLRNKSVFNYWAKIAIKGLLANLGIKRDKKQLRQYQKAIKEHKLPDYSNDF